MIGDFKKILFKLRNTCLHRHQLAAAVRFNNYNVFKFNKSIISIRPRPAKTWVTIIDTRYVVTYIDPFQNHGFCFAFGLRLRSLV